MIRLISEITDSLLPMSQVRQITYNKKGSTLSILSNGGNIKVANISEEEYYGLMKCIMAGDVAIIDYKDEDLSKF